MNSSLLINLAILSGKPVGIGRYASNLFPYLKSLSPTLLTNHRYVGFNCIAIPESLSEAFGRKGHFDRLKWTQFGLPSQFNSLSSKLIFSPTPELPLWSECRGIVTVHDLIPLRFPRWRSPLYLYNRFYVPEVARQAQHLICVSEATAKDIVNFCGVSTKKITPILSGYDQQHFQPTFSSKSDQKTRYFLYLGRHDPHKNIARLIDAFQEGCLDDDIELWFVGPEHPKHTPALKQQAAELGLGARVKFLDYVSYEELPGIISGAIALVFPSLWEGFGLPILEAMGCGTPVITSNLSSMPEVAGDAAILIDPYNTNEMSDAMQAIANDSALRQQLSTAGLARAKQFSWEKTGRETVEVLKRFL